MSENTEKPVEKTEKTEKPVEAAKDVAKTAAEPAPKEKPVEVEDIDAKIRDAVARERKKAIEETVAKLKAEAEEKARLEKMEAADRLKAEKEKAEKETVAAKAEAVSAGRKLDLYRGLTTGGLQPAADTALPMIEQAFAAELDGGAADAAAALKNVRKNMPFLFKSAQPTEEKKAEEKKPMPGAQAASTTVQGGTAPEKKTPAPDPRTAKLQDYLDHFQRKAAG